MNKRPLILEIKGNSLDDGPGIRTVIFFKGCPLSCTWCHNPESKSAGFEISFDARQCIGCNTCIDTCPEDALSRDDPYFIDRDKCDLCFKCVDNCPANALTRVGRWMGPDEILAAVTKDKPFFDTSGGGVTLSGGEPIMYMEFVSDLLKALKKEGIHILLETCGHFNFERFEDLIYPYVDTIYYDIKLYNADEHKLYCGVPNEVILENFIRLHTLSVNGGADVLARIPLIPHITDTQTNMEAIANFLQRHHVVRAELLAYNPLWHEKSHKIGVESPYSKDEVMAKWMSKGKIHQCEEIFRAAGIAV